MVSPTWGPFCFVLLFLIKFRCLKKKKKPSIKIFVKGENDNGLEIEGLKLNFPKVDRGWEIVKL